jgi:soluble lytic murein transglycosylase-like protein
MKRKRARMAVAAPAIPFFLLLAIQASPSHPAIPAKTKVLSASSAAGRIRLELAGASRSRFDLGVISRDDLNAAIAGQPRRFGLFRPESAVAVADQRALMRRLPFGAILAAAAERNQVDPLLLAAVVETESRFASRAVSREGAVGLMQLLPSTGRDFGVKNLRDPYANVDAGSRLLRRLLARFKDRPELALAAYNTGPETVARFGCVPPYRETQDFVRRVLTRYAEHCTTLARGPLAQAQPANFPRSASRHRPVGLLAAARRVRDRSAMLATPAEREGPVRAAK